MKSRKKDWKSYVDNWLDIEYPDIVISCRHTKSLYFNRHESL